jgi:arginyl-tRNA synthetase
MNLLLENIRNQTLLFCSSVYRINLENAEVIINPTRKEFAGDFTLLVFPLLKKINRNAESLGEELGSYIKENIEEISGFNVVKGFLNLEIDDTYWIRFIKSVTSDPNYGESPSNGDEIMIEFSSPNTNKPLHLGHIRNILIGWACSKVFKAAGFRVINTQIINDRGIAICKSMVAWKLFGEGKTPEDERTKGDHFVGQYYVLFEKKVQEEYDKWKKGPEAQALLNLKRKTGQSSESFFKEFKHSYFNEYSQLGRRAKQMLIAWEKGDSDTIALWKKMNNWVYQGFEETYMKLGVEFDKLYYESNTWQIGREEVYRGLENGYFYRNEDGSVWVDLNESDMGQKVLLRSDQTSVYITQDIGTAKQRYEDFGIPRMVYIVADEQNYHFQVLFEVLKILREPFASGLYHLSYGMVDLPSGKMKSREGTTVDADDLIGEVVEEARKLSDEKGELAELTASERESIIGKIGLAALKFFIVKVNPKKRITFDPEASLDLQGQTGPYIQNAYVRIRSVIRKANEMDFKNGDLTYTGFQEAEKTIVKWLFQYPQIILDVTKSFDPSAIANFAYELAKSYHRFYHELPILNAEPEARIFRIELSNATAQVLRHSMNLIGIEMPDRM